MPNLIFTTILGYSSFHSDIQNILYEAKQEPSVKRHKKAKQLHQNINLQNHLCYCLDSLACQHGEGDSVLCYMWFLAICPLSTPPTLPFHILMSYKDTLSPLSPSPLGNCKNHNNQSLWKPTLSHSSCCLWNTRKHTQGFPDLPPFLVVPSCALSKPSSSSKSLWFSSL